MTRLPLWLLVATLGCSKLESMHVEETRATAVAGVSEIAQAVSERRSSETDSGPYLGFDTSRYPGDAAMQSWREHADYDWVGFYLPAPCHKDESWSGKRETIERMGWGVAVVYVGQQTWGRTPRRGARVPARATCTTNLVTPARGRIDADDAIARSMAEGFAFGTAIFLDLERMETVPSAMREYYLAWTERVLEDGRFRPAYYAHTHNATTVYADVRALFDRLGVDEDPPFWIAGGSNFGRDRHPREVGHEFAAVWQGVLDTWEKHATVRLPIDVNVAAVPSPSAVQIASD